MKLQDLLEVTQSRDYGYEVLSQNPELFSTRKTIAGHKISFVAEFNEDEQAWEIAFFDRTDGNSRTKPTDTHEPLKTLAFVSASMDEFVERYHPEKLLFSIGKDSLGEKREAIYRKMFEKNWPQFKLDDEYDAKSDKYLIYTKAA